jgi:protein-L-isoaspartate(D-aspartate) O-methyltransferase
MTSAPGGGEGSAPRQGVPSLVLLASLLVLVWCTACTDGSSRPEEAAEAVAVSVEVAGDGRAMNPSEQSTDRYARERERMVSQQLEARGLSDPRVLAAMGKVPRHEFVPERLRDAAYEDRPLPIGSGQTISQPYIVAAMSELARLDASSRVLEIGTGSGYQAAVLAELAGEVFTIEIVEELAASADATLDALGYTGIHVRQGDGYRGWPEEAPFDAVVVTAAPPRVPQPLLDQLKLGGRMVIPVGSWDQSLEVHEKTATGIERKVIFPVRFVPMVGEVQK